MNKNASLLILRGGINKIGNMMYDYANTIWLASLGSLGQSVLGIYKTTELMVSILFNPIGGVISDRYSRKRVLVITDLICAFLCLLVSFITEKTFLITGIICANIILSITFSFSRPANKSFITEVVPENDILKYNSHLELVLQIITVTSPIISFFIMKFADIRMALMINSLTFFIAALIVYFIPQKDFSYSKSSGQITIKEIYHNLIEGFIYIKKQREIFFFLIVASLVNFFFSAYNYLLPFSDVLFNQKGAYASILTYGAIGSIIGALISAKIKNSNKNLFRILFLTALGVLILPLFTFLNLPNSYSFVGNLVCELFMTVFNIHFFSQIQRKVDKEYMGRVFSTIFTLSIVLAPISTLLMTILPTINFMSFIIIGICVLTLSFICYCFQAVLLKD